MFVDLVVHELRYLSRLARTWALVVVAVGIGLAIFVYYSLVHHSYSGVSQTVGSIAPRFLIHSFGSISLLVAVWLSTFLIFNFRERNESDRVEEVLHSKSFSNLTYLCSVVVANVAIVFASTCVLVFLVQAYGLLVPHIDVFEGDTVEASSLALFVFVDVPVAALFWAATGGAVL